MAELDKFKRRVIRSVARMLIQEKMPEEAVWKQLKEETKCDCKLLWDRMRALTLKKMKRLFLAEDRLNSIIPVAQMSLTDWLMFDLVLVHEDIDVIGEDNKDQPAAVQQPSSLADLFEVVITFDIENKVGDELANAWTAATFAYNKKGRQCSPMLLQRRWYQLKKQTRWDFYKFWYSYRGNPKLLINAMRYVPNELRQRIAKRFPHVITQQFMKWDNLIEQRAVILPEEFENRFQDVKACMKMSEENDQDVVLLEPNIETIELGDADSDEDNDTKLNKQAKDSTEQEENNFIKTLSGVVVKTEPTEEIDFNDSSYTSRLANELRERDTQLLEYINEDSSETNLGGNNYDSSNIAENTMNEADEVVENTVNDTNALVINTFKDTDELAKNVLNDVPKGSNFECSSRDEANKLDEESNTVMPQITNVFGNIYMDFYSPLEKTPKHLDITTSEICDEYRTNMGTQEKNESPIDCDVNKKLQDFLQKSMIDEAHNNVPTKTFPQPSKNINDNKSKIDLINNQISNQADDCNVDKKLVAYLHNTEKTNVELLDCLDKTVKPAAKESSPLMETSDENDLNNKLKVFLKQSKHETGIEKMPGMDNIKIELQIKKDVEDTNQFLGVVPSDTIFADDGVELVDDGIELEDDDEMKYSKSDSFTSKENEEEDCPKFDKKLLMQPIVYTTKVEDMVAFKKKEIYNLTGKDIIEAAVIESKPIHYFDQIIKSDVVKADIDSVSQEGKINVGKDNLMSSSDSETETIDVISYDKRVKLSSYLLQKPKSRNYHPIQLCKNPDFNTRLKRLTFGFLSSIRNRSYLKTLKPMTVDVSKAFESKLIDGTLYLKPTEVCPINAIKEIKDTDQTSTVIPSAMSVQSLIDNDVDTSAWDSSKYDVNIANDVPQKQLACKLPNIDDIIRMNQRIITAEVSPIQSHGVDKEWKPPVQLLSENHFVTQNSPDNTKTDPVNTTSSTEVTNVIDNQVKTPRYINKKKFEERYFLSRLTKKINTTRKNLTSNKTKPSSISADWTAANLFKNEVDIFDDILLTVDSLDKMLSVINGAKPEVITPKKKYKLKNFTKVKTSTTEIVVEKIRPQVSSTPKTVVEEVPPEKTSTSEIEVENKPKTNSEEKNIENYCCWARLKLDYPKRRVSHTCPRICQCCCRSLLVVKINKRPGPRKHSSILISDDDESPISENVNKAIENVVQMSRQSAIDENIVTNKNTVRTEASIQCDLPTEVIDKNININHLQTNEHENLLLPPPVPCISIISTQPNYVKKTRRYTRSKHRFSKQSPQIIDVSDQSSKFTKYKQDHIISTQGSQFETADKILQEKSLNLNTRSKSKCPIYLGKNKVLLTTRDIPLPDDQIDTPILPQVAPLHDEKTPVLVLPDGVQLLLLPNGQVSFSVEPTAKLDSKQLAQLPIILEAVQKQMAASNSTISQLNPTKSSNDIIDCDSDENAKTEMSPQILNNNIETQVNDIPREESNDTVVSNDAANKTLTSPMSSLIQDQNTTLLLNAPDQCINIENYSCPANNKSLDDPDNITSSLQRNKTVDKNPAVNRNTLLSDLMEMSGISAEDTSQISPEDPQSLQPVAASINVESVTDQSQPYKINVKRNDCLPHVSNLKTISSFSELKDACGKNKKFYKLDLETGLVSIVSVCIKKKSHNVNSYVKIASKPCPVIDPKTVIDLTEENEMTETYNTVEKAIITSNNFIVGKGMSLLKHTYKSPRDVKPVRLFKSVNILNRGTSGPSDIPKLNTMQSLNKSKRKQSLLQVSDLIEELNENVTDNIGQDDYIWTFEEEVSHSDYESSDEEPLATKAKRMRTDDTSISAQTVNISEQKDNNTASITAVAMAVETLLPSTELANEVTTSASSTISVTPNIVQEKDMSGIDLVNDDPSAMEVGCEYSIVDNEELADGDDIQNTIVESEMDFMDDCSNESNGEDCILGF